MRLVIAIFALGLSLLIYSTGRDHGHARATADHETRLAQQLADTLIAARAYAEQAADEREAQISAVAAADARALETRLQGQIHALETARAECEWGAARLRLLNDATAANDRGKR